MPSRSAAALLAVPLLVVVAACGSLAVPALPVGSAAPDPPPTTTPVSSPSGVASPSATPAAAAAIAVLDGVRAFAADEDATYRVSFSGESRHTVDVLDLNGSLDVAGDDVALRATFRFDGEGSGRTDYRRVGGRDWVRFDKGEWRTLKSPDASEVVDPFAGTEDGTRLQFLGPVDDEPGRFLVQLTGTYLHPALIPAGNLTAEKITRTKLLLVTDEAGVPVRGTWTMRGQGRVSGQLQAIAIDLDLTWSKVGEPLTIKAP